MDVACVEVAAGARAHRPNDLGGPGSAGHPALVAWRGDSPPQDGKHVTRQQANLKPHTKQPAVAGAVWWCVRKHALPTAQTP